MTTDTLTEEGPHLEQRYEVYGIQLRLAQYPILAPRIRALMRQELFSKGIISVEAFETEVRKKAIISQHREGLGDPFGQESEQVWNQRLAVIRDQLTDFYFAYNFPSDRLNRLIQRTLAGHTPEPTHTLTLTFNPELAPLELLFTQGEAYEALPPEEQRDIRHHLREIIVVLIKTMLSDQLEFIGIAKEIFTVKDLKEIRRRLIGRGKIGGKAAGLLLAQKILQKLDGGEDDVHLDLAEHVQIPDSYFIGADVFYDFLLLNGFTHYMNQKYRRAEEIEADYPKLRAAYMESQFPSEIVEGLRRMLQDVGNAPLIVRSSSLLEVHFGAALAGKYESVFCPNQGSLAENLTALLKAVAQVYASTLSPDALLYRRQMGLVDYDERMAVLIQKLQGTRYHNYLFPMIAGVGYSHNPFRWNPKIRREDGFLRLVAGFGTRAVERVANDYPRIVALSHPQLRPTLGYNEIRKYSQHYIDVFDMNDNTFKTLPVSEVIGSDYPALRYIASLDKGEYISPIFARVSPKDAQHLVLTFDQLVQDGNFIDLMRTILAKLEYYHVWPVDIEFAVEIEHGDNHPDYKVKLLQCRPQVSSKQRQAVEIPDDIPEADIVLQTRDLVPHGVVSGIRHIVYVDPRSYKQAPSYAVKMEIARIIGRLNQRLADDTFILIGPGRWGSSDVDLGVRVTYSDIYNAKMLIEVSRGDGSTGAEPSYGTHFFQDLVEASIYPLPIVLGNKGATLNVDFLCNAPNALARYLPDDAEYSDYIRLIEVPIASQGRVLNVIMNDEQERAVGYLTSPPEKERR